MQRPLLIWSVAAAALITIMLFLNEGVTRNAASGPEPAPVPGAWTQENSASAKTSQPIAPSSGSGARAPVIASKAPWATGFRALDARDYGMLIANARTAPLQGSYALAAKALSMCASILGGYDKLVREIGKASNPKEQAARRIALMELRRPCEGLGDEASMSRERDTLYVEGGKAGDVLLALARSQAQLTDVKLPRDERQRTLVDLLALRDAHAFGSVRSALTAKGATFDGSPIPDKDRGAFLTALQLVECSQYGACAGPNSTVALRDCAMHGECDYLDTMNAAQRFVPPYLYERAGPYYLRVRDRLANGQFSAFGVP